MSATGEQANPARASLTRSNDDVPDFPGLAPIGERFGRGLADLLAGFGFGESVVRARAPQMTSVAEWLSQRSPDDALLRFQMHPMKGAMLLSIPANLVGHLLDLFFGGDGNLTGSAKNFSAAELRLLKRIGEACVPLLGASWKDAITIKPEFMSMEPDGRMPALANGGELVAVQCFAVNGKNEQFEIQSVFQQSALRTVEALRGTGASETEGPVDAAWRARLEQAALQVCLPVRSVFARPELSLEKLMSLKAGDMIPVLMPRHVPVNIGERLFAYASVGESNGRTAIKIESFAEPRTDYE